eukprot:TRINITY_DN20743_c0_g1_i1.p1 TRINITY_DN20743_c0_g1~~TRINITY_DN20743_c0_g1_i1.p1  ORF type:complete len:187 (+),score=36.61 TRINITY_DN20743_c0_g1_i1:87-647(+)
MALKLALVGRGGVGKSTIAIRFLYGVFEETYDPTIEDSYRQQVSVDGEESMLDILDTAGQEDFSSMKDFYIETYSAFVIIFSIDEISSFEKAKNLYSTIDRQKEDEKFAAILVGNKSDLTDLRTVATSDAESFAKSCGIPYIESSAKSGEHITEIFHSIVREMRKMKNVDQDDDSDKSKKRSCTIF